MEEGPSRKLAVMLHADVVGSTTLGANVKSGVQALNQAAT